MISALLLLNALALVAGTFRSHSLLSDVTLSNVGDLVVSQAIIYPIAILFVVVAIALWRFQRWAWVATMIFMGISMALGMAGYFGGTPQYANMLLNVLIVFYLNARAVQNTFARRRAGEVDG
jgi:uncharacterized membrane protein (DUF2068 family)